jgi:aspartyl protease family protein
MNSYGIGSVLVVMAVIAVFGNTRPAPPEAVVAAKASPWATQATPVEKPQAHAALAQEPAAPVTSGSAVVLIRAPDGHFYANARVNGTSVRFMIDTGATSVALSREDAARAGLAGSDADYSATAMGAGGAIAIRPVILDSVTVGSIDARGVQGAVIKQGLGVSLLGQSWLSRLKSVTIEGDRMTLS